MGPHHTIIARSSPTVGGALFQFFVVLRQMVRHRHETKVRSDCVHGVQCKTNRQLTMSAFDGSKEAGMEEEDAAERINQINTYTD